MKPGDRLGPYEIVALLGVGGMGEVYRAKDTRLGREVAIKVLPAEFATDPDRLRRFEHEARAVAALDHPNILAIHDIGSHEGAPYLVTELLEGESLRDKLTGSPLPPRKVLGVAIQVASGLAAAHEKGIVHRDLKPENLFVTSDGHVKILDFGIAKLVAPRNLERPALATTAVEATEAGMTLGTVGYMSPEQVRGQAVDQRSDIFSFGCVLYEMVSGQRAFWGKTIADTISAILHEDPPRLSGAGRSIPPELQRIITRCLEKDAADRLESARDLGFALQAMSGAAELAKGPRIAGTGWPTSLEGVRGLRGLARPIIAVPTVLLIVLAAVFWLARPRTALSFARRDWILVTDVQNDTGQPVFDRSLLTALTVSLEQSPHANVFPRSRITTALKRMKRDPVSRIDAEIGREICMRENVRGLVMCGIVRVGSRYVLSAQIIDPRTGEAVRSFEEQARGEDEVLPALSSLAVHIRKALGESLGSIQRSNRPLPFVTTASLHALELYAEGQHLWDSGKYGEAVKLFEAALQDDPDFAMAHAALGNAYMSHIFSEPVKGRQSYERALALVARTTDRERLLIQAASASANGNTGEAERIYRAYLATYPDDTPVRYSLGTMLMMSKRPSEALEQFQAVIRVAPSSASACINAATSLTQLRRCREALEAYAKAFALEPTWEVSENLNNEYGFALVAVGEVAKAREVFGKAAAIELMRPRGLRSLALVDLYQGHYRDAAGRLRETILLNEAKRAELSASRDHVYLATTLEGQGDRAGQVAELDRANAILARLNAEVAWSADLGVAYARAGSLPQAEKLRETVAKNARQESVQEMSKLHRLEGEIELARGDRAAALGKLRFADREFRNALTVESLARAALAADEIAEAVAAYEALFQMDILGWEAQQPWVAAHYSAALAYRAGGQLDKARETTDALLALWKDADPDLPLLRSTQELRRQLDH
jgi:tetratricopeptide (TPR) repeat protein